MGNVISFIIEQFYTNEFMTAAVVAAPMTALVYTARNLPVQLWRIIKRQLLTELAFNSDIPDYMSVQEYVANEVVSERFSRTFLYTTEDKWDENGDRTVNFRGLTIGYGKHIGFWKRRFVWIDRNLESGQQTDKFKERLTMSFLTRDRTRVNEFARLVRMHGQRATSDAVPLWVNNDGWWRVVGNLPRRPLSSVFTPNDEIGTLLRHLRTFEQQRDRYREWGLPYHTGVMLTGEPGTGKTSIVHAVASELGRSLYYLNLGGVENDKQLTELVSSARNWERSMLVIEDADASRADVNRNAPDDEKVKPPLTLSAMLNLLDGLLTPDGLMVIATTNHPERLDKALMRPGRFDLKLNIGRLGWNEFVAMARMFGHDLSLDDPRRETYKPQPGATLRARLLDEGVDGVLRQEIRSVA